MTELSKKRSQAGRRGGLVTLERYGVEHYRAIGAKGAQVTRVRYGIKPVGTSQYAMVRRDTGEIVAFLDRVPEWNR